MPSVLRQSGVLVMLAMALLLAGQSSPARSSGAQEDYTYLHYLLYLADKNPDDAGPKDRIFFKNEIVYCTGTSILAEVNNRAAAMMEQGNFAGAVDLLDRALKNSALFFPFRYNLGVSYLHLRDLKKSLLHFRKAQAVVPEYYGTYLQMGSIYQQWYRDNEAIDSYRQALKWNKNELNTYVLIGDLFFNRNQLQLAKKYYDQCLRIDHRFNNAVLGKAKVHFKEGDYYKALVTLKAIDTRKEYDRAYHYYYAETSFKLQDYKTASQQYVILLEDKNDKFFITNSVTLIEHKLNLSNRFIEK
ncbi:MAG TPA: tetratricopeptide repeat protein [Spirochaetota bacterium]|nr:tetratricopeptide repeat protein [Spirochaetota bacterium]HPV39840.1 tetratricopeptide repeat protein [Spirochaetota bacterium]